MTDTTKLPVACLAPPLTDVKLAKYAALGTQLVGEIASEYARCLACVKAWWELPESKLPAVKFTAVKGGHTPAEMHVVPLEAGHIASLDAVTPWLRELETLKTLFDVLTGEVRDAAFALLWYAIEISLDREPVTQEKLI